MKQFIFICILFILLAGCSNSSTSSTINQKLMDDNAQIVSIANRTTISDLSDNDIMFIEEFLDTYYNDEEKFTSYNEKEQQLILEAVEMIEKMKKD